MSLLLCLLGCPPPVIVYDSGGVSVPDDTDTEVPTDSGDTQPQDNDHDGYTDDVDCDDDNAAVNPGRDEIWYDGTDQDCDGNDMDQDLDGYRSERWDPTGDDCDDGDHLVHPDATEAFYDGVDQDCDKTCDYDADADGEGIPKDQTATGDYENETYKSQGFDPCEDTEDLDCDDEDASINSAADEIVDGIDNDCDSSADGDWSEIANAVELRATTTGDLGRRLQLLDVDGSVGDEVFASLPSYDGVFGDGGYVARWDSADIAGRPGGSLGLNEAGFSLQPDGGDLGLGTAMVVADLDDDGRVELAATGPGDGAVWLVDDSLVEGDASTNSPDGRFESSTWSVDGDLAFYGDLLAVGSASGQGAQGVVFLLTPDLGGALTIESDYAVKVLDDDSAIDSLGASIAVLDVDNDGVDDLVIGAPDDSAAKPNGGSIYVVDGSTFGSSTVVDIDDISSVRGDKSGWRFGQQLTVVEDYDGDGSSDLAVVSEDTASTRIHLIPTDGTFFSKPATLIDDRIELDRGSDRDWDLVGTGDLDANGRGDIVVGDPDAQVAYVFLGEGLSSRSTTLPEDAEARVTGGADFGSSAAVGDVDGDGIEDIVVSSPGDGRLVVLPTAF